MLCLIFWYKDKYIYFNIFPPFKNFFFAPRENFFINYFYLILLIYLQLFNLLYLIYCYMDKYIYFSIFPPFENYFFPPWENLFFPTWEYFFFPPGENFFINYFYLILSIYLQLFKWIIYPLNLKFLSLSLNYIYYFTSYHNLVYLNINLLGNFENIYYFVFNHN